MANTTVSKTVDPGSSPGLCALGVLPNPLAPFPKKEGGTGDLTPLPS